MPSVDCQRSQKSGAHRGAFKWIKYGMKCGNGQTVRMRSECALWRIESELTFGGQKKEGGRASKHSREISQLKWIPDFSAGHGAK